MRIVGGKLLDYPAEPHYITEEEIPKAWGDEVTQWPLHSLSRRAAKFESVNF